MLLQRKIMHLSILLMHLIILIMLFVYYFIVAKLDKEYEEEKNAKNAHAETPIEKVIMSFVTTPAATPVGKVTDVPVPRRTTSKEKESPIIESAPLTQSKELPVTADTPPSKRKLPLAKVVVPVVKGSKGRGQQACDIASSSSDQPLGKRVKK